MTKPLKKADTPLSPEEPDAWERFESAVDKVMKGGPQHREKKPAKQAIEDAADG